jgi:hypothetical protein
MGILSLRQVYIFLYLRKKTDFLYPTWLYSMKKKALTPVVANLPSSTCFREWILGIEFLINYFCASQAHRKQVFFDILKIKKSIMVIVDVEAAESCQAHGESSRKRP